MATIAKLMNKEIRRLAKSEARALVAGIKKDTVRLKKDNAELKRRVAELERENRRLARAEERRRKEDTQAPPEKVQKARFSSKGIRSLRKKLGLSQDQFAKLVGVSSVSIYNWESKGGALKLRASTAAKLLAVRGIGSKEARDRLSKIDAAARARAGKKRRARSRNRKKSKR